MTDQDQPADDGQIGAHAALPWPAVAAGCVAPPTTLSAPPIKELRLVVAR